jgi:hypothetical protein
LASKFALVPLAELDDGHIKRLIRELELKQVPGGRQLQASTINKILARIRTMVSVAFDRGLSQRRIAQGRASLPPAIGLPFSRGMAQVKKAKLFDDIKEPRFYRHLRIGWCPGRESNPYVRQENKGFFRI